MAVSETELQDTDEVQPDSGDDWAVSSNEDEAFDFFSGGTQRPSAEDIPPEASLDNDESTGKSWLWQPLRHVNEIRIFMIDLDTLPGDEIRCHFQNTSLSTPTSYLALSYAWGETKSDGSHLTHTILCDDMPMRITENLFQALSYIRHVWRTDTRTINRMPISALWADAMCIDQHNLIERARQVMIMDQVYSQASSLIVWLGSTQVFTSGPSPSISRGLLSNQPWFGRRWVIQEAMSCTQDHFWLAGSEYTIVTNLVQVLVDETQDLLTGRTFAQYRHQTTHLMGNLITFTKFDCSDDRDRIYALRNISIDGGHLIIDYTKTVKDVYTSLARQWLDQGHLSAVLLCAVSCRKAAESYKVLHDSDLPTWAPDWTIDFSEDKTVDMNARLDQVQRRNSEASRPVAQFVQRRLGLVLQIECWLFLYCPHVSYSDQDCHFCTFASATGNEDLDFFNQHDGTVGWILLPSGDAFSVRSDFTTSTGEAKCYTLGWKRTETKLYAEVRGWSYSRSRHSFRFSEASPRALPQLETVCLI